MNKVDPKQDSIPLNPGSWGLWLFIGVLWLFFACLSIHQTRTLGMKLSALLKPLAKRRFRVIEINLRLAFPEMEAHELAKLAKLNFEHTCAGFFETAYVLLRGSKHVLAHSEVRGRTVLDDALKKGKNILLIGAHYTSMETCGTIMADVVPMAIVHRHQNVPVANYLFLRNRHRLFTDVIHRDDGKGILNFVRDTSKQRILWLAPDQDMGHQRSVFVPFLGVEKAATLKVISRMVAKNDLTPLFLEFAYNSDTKKWVIEYLPISEYPTEDDATDAEILNRVLGESVRRRPEQYYWVHRRFKSLPDGSTRKYQ